MELERLLEVTQASATARACARPPPQVPYRAPHLLSVPGKGPGTGLPNSAPGGRRPEGCARSVTSRQSDSAPETNDVRAKGFAAQAPPAMARSWPARREPGPATTRKCPVGQPQRPVPLAHVISEGESGGTRSERARGARHRTALRPISPPHLASLDRPAGTSAPTGRSGENGTR